MLCFRVPAWRRHDCPQADTAALPTKQLASGGRPAAVLIPGAGFQGAIQWELKKFAGACQQPCLVRHLDSHAVGSLQQARPSVTATAPSLQHAGVLEDCKQVR